MVAPKAETPGVEGVKKEPKLTLDTTKVPKEGGKEEGVAAAPKQQGQGAKGPGATPAFGEGYAVGSIIGQETGGSRTGGTTPVTIGTQYGLTKLQQQGTPGAGGGPGYFPEIGAGGPRLSGRATTSGASPTQSSMRRTASKV